MATFKAYFKYVRLVIGGTLFFFIISPTLQAASALRDVPFSEGEKIQYDITKLKVKIGEATLNVQGLRRVDNRDALLIVFTAKALKFSDKEKIYLDPATFLPIRIERELNIFGKRERIVEYYSANNGSVKIVKTVKGKTTQQIIDKDTRLENVYGFIYRYRKSGKFEIGENVQIHLPTRDVQFKLVKVDKVKVADIEQDAYYMKSTPPQYRVWFDRSAQKIPLRIDGAVGFGKTSMIMKGYWKSDEK